MTSALPLPFRRRLRLLWLILAAQCFVEPSDHRLLEFGCWRLHVFIEIGQSSARPKLKQVLNAELGVHENDSLIRRRVATQIIKTLNHLKQQAPAEFAAVRSELPKDVRNLDVRKVRFGRFTVLAYKREGGSAFSARERRRMDRRRAELAAGRPADGGFGLPVATAPTKGPRLAATLAREGGR